MNFQTQDDKNRYLESPHVIRATGPAGQIVFRTRNSGSFVKETLQPERSVLPQNRDNEGDVKENNPKLKFSSKSGFTF